MRLSVRSRPRWRPTRRPLSPGVWALAVAACSGDAPITPTAPAFAACAEGTRLTVTPDAGGVAVSWAPACAVSLVAVVDSATFDAAWGVRAPAPTLRSPQRLYETPAGAQLLGVSRALRRGVPYVVVLGVRETDPVTGVVGERSVAEAPFTP